MEVWIDGPKAEPNGVIILDLDHEPTGTELFLWSIATAPKARGTGLGNALLDFVENRARALGRSAVSLATNSRLKDRIAWYQRRGFTISHYEELPDRTLVGMRKTISDPAKA